MVLIDVNLRVVSRIAEIRWSLLEYKGLKTPKFLKTGYRPSNMVISPSGGQV